MLRIDQVKLNINEPVAKIPQHIAKMLKMKDLRISEWRIVRESVDARHKPDIVFIYSVDFRTDQEESVLKRAAHIRGLKLARTEKVEYTAPVSGFEGSDAAVPVEKRPVIAGFGPCGMFAALILAEAGMSPLVLERGKPVAERTADVEHFWKTGELDDSSNVQFGEGGAGTFSDGKLTTGIKDPRIAKVNAEFIGAGADPEIAYKSMPHIGTDVLREVVTNIRKKIESLGGEVRFGSCVTEIMTDVGRVSSVVINGTEKISCGSFILSPGNSARDTFEMLQRSGVKLTAKPFSVGVRIEHLQSQIDQTQYGAEVNDTEGRLGAAAYKLSYHCQDGRGVYTFCMCPGGFVVGAASEQGGVVTNGMSYNARDGKNANSALLVSISPADLTDDPDADPLAGVRFQRALEQKAFAAGGGRFFAPVQRVGDFLGRAAATQPGAASADLICAAPASALPVEPTYRPGVRWTSMADCFPQFVTEAMREALPHMANKLRGFDMPEAVITGVETRSSSPVRIPRGDDYMSVSLSGLYPGGEGAGYAGGIMSAAVDGIRIAEAVIRSLHALPSQEPATTGTSAV